MKSPWLALIIMMLSLGLADCGKKGPPVPPDDDGKQQESPAPDNPEYRRGTPLLTGQSDVEYKDLLKRVGFCKNLQI